MKEYREFDLPELKRIMRECAGEDESLPLDGDIADVPFAELGYDSLALLETTSLIDRRYRISLPDDIVSGAPTPRVYITMVNSVLGRVPAL